jgi:hypothetical protein
MRIPKKPSGFDPRSETMCRTSACGNPAAHWSMTSSGTRTRAVFRVPRPGLPDVNNRPLFFNFVYGCHSRRLMGSNEDIDVLSTTAGTKPPAGGGGSRAPVSTLKGAE